MKKETRFKVWLLAKLRTIPHSWWEKIQQVSISGTPDILGLVSGWFVALELKTEDGEATELQLYKLRQIESAGGYAAVVDPRNAEHVLRELNELGTKRVTD